MAVRIIHSQRYLCAKSSIDKSILTLDCPKIKRYILGMGREILGPLDINFQPESVTEAEYGYAEPLKRSFRETIGLWIKSLEKFNPVVLIARWKEVLTLPPEEPIDKY